MSDFIATQSSILGH